MAVESVGITEGSGRDIAVDTISAKEHQLIKMEFGADGVATMVEDKSPLPTAPGLPTAARLQSAAIDANVAGINTILSGTASQTIRLFRFFLANPTGAAISAKWRSAATDLHPSISIGAGGAWILDFDGEPWFVTAVAEDLILFTSAVGLVGRFYYTKSVP